MAKKNIAPNISFNKKLDTSKIMIQFDNEEPEPVIELLDDESVVTFTLRNTEFSSLEFNNAKKNRKFKIYVEKKDD